MSDDTENETIISEAVPINEFIARKIEVLAEHVRMGRVIGFDLCWNVGQFSKTPEKFGGVMLTAALQMDEFLAPAPSDMETPEKIQRDIVKALASAVIEVEDRTEPQVSEETVIPEDEDDFEDFHIVDDDDESEE